MGSNKNFTLNNKGFSVFQSPNIYIGEAAKRRDEPMVLGSQLQNLLVRILRLLGDAQALGDMNVPQKLTLFPNIHVAGTLSQEVNNIMQEFNLGTLEPGQNPNPEFEKNLDENGIAISDTISGNSKLLSNRHFIEPNRISNEQQNQNQTGDGGQDASFQGTPPPKVSISVLLWFDIIRFGFWLCAPTLIALPYLPSNTRSEKSDEIGIEELRKKYGDS